MAAQTAATSLPQHSAYRSLVERAACRFKSSGRNAYYYARCKLGNDPVFAALLRDGHIHDGAHIVDLGCGQGLLAALLASDDAPSAWTLHGFDLRAGAITTAERALADFGERVRFEVGDIRAVQLPPCNVVVVLDVLHYIDYEAQQRALARIYEALAPGGKLLLRVGDAARGWRFRITLLTDWFATATRGTRQRRFWCRPLQEWIALLEAVGFEVQSQPMSEGTPFANVLLVAVNSRALR